MSEQQAKKLQLKPRKRLSPWIEKSCLLLSANVSYENAARDFEELTGIAIGHSTQQRLVHRADWAAETATVVVNALSLDGGKARIRTPEKGPSVWLDYKAVSLHGIRCDAWFQENEALLESVNSQPLAPVVNFLNYVAQHQARIPNYQSDQQQGLCIGSGAVESTIKRIGVRIKISGAQWKSENVGRVLKQRCAYLNRFAA